MSAVTAKIAVREKRVNREDFRVMGPPWVGIMVTAIKIVETATKIVEKFALFKPENRVLQELLRVNYPARLLPCISASGTGTE